MRGQYAAGAVGGEPVKGYLEEANVPAGSRAETFVALRAHINNWRWANVPFFLRTGKRLQKTPVGDRDRILGPAVLRSSRAVARNYGNRLDHPVAAGRVDPASDAREGAGQRHAYAAGEPEPRLAAGVHASAARKPTSVC